jgi:ABC-type transporter Mla subunit MlaD
MPTHADALRTKFKQAMQAADEKLKTCNKALATNEAVLNGEGVDAKAVKKAQQGMKDAQRGIDEAKKQLKIAQQQHEAAVDALAACRDPRFLGGDDAGMLTFADACMLADADACMLTYADVC